MYYTILAVTFISLISLIGAFTLFLKQDILHKIIIFLVSLAAGTLIGDVFLHIIPELFNEASEESIISLSFAFIIGIMMFFALEKFLHWHHHHNDMEEKYPHPIAINNLVADALHNFLDGIIIASAFAVNFELGIATTIAVVLHEIPQEIGDFGVMIHTKMKPATALMFNFLSALFALLGAFIGIFLNDKVANLTPIMLALAGGGFIYIAVADLLPEIKNESNWKKSILQLVMIIVGIAIMYLLRFLEI